MPILTTLRALLLALPVLAVTGAWAQGIDAEIDEDRPVALVADSLVYDSEAKRLTAEGNVEVYYGDRTLTADRIVYDDTTRRIEATGDIVLRDPTGTTVFADAADLDVDLRDGLIEGAQSAIDRYSRLAAVEARRVDDRYNVLSKAVYSACEVCEENPTPLWRIRARRVIHDEEDRIIHYEDAVFEVFGVPVLWTPYFQHPDPTVDRATGFLAPEVLSSAENYGYGLKTPFYWVIDEQTDATITPFLTTNDGLFGELELRRAFANGFARFYGTLGRSDFTGEQEVHGHVDTEGRFGFRGFDWGWDVKFASDDGYLRYFDYSTEDRLTSTVYVRRYERDGFVDLSGVRFQSFRRREPTGQIPVVVPDFLARRDFAESFTGGTIGLFSSAQGLYRTNGEDTGRLTVGIDWEREAVLPMGLAVRGFAEMRGDLFLVDDESDPDRDDVIFRFWPLAGVELRYPLIGEPFEGVTHVLEPIGQAIVAPNGGNDADIPNEDSQITEFDELSLFERDHFTGYDRVEEGPRFNLGVRYRVETDLGLSADVTVGRTLRLDDADEFDVGSGLNNAESDWVGTWSVAYDPYVSVSQRLRLGDDGLEVTRNETLVEFDLDPVSFGLEYVFLDAEPGAQSLVDREEISGRLRVRFLDDWTANAFLRRDLEQDEFVTLGGGLRFRNECCAVTAFVRRDFTDQPNVPASTGFGLQVELFTLGGSGVRLGG